MDNLQREKIWDPVSRLWHWILAIAIILNLFFGNFMTFDTVVPHMYIGILILGLMVFRILWGFIGPAPVKFKTLATTASSFNRYLKTVSARVPSGTPGHNPLGAISVFAMLLVITAQAFTGLFVESEDFFENGPLYDYVSEETVEVMIGWHHTLSDVVLILVILHVAAIFFYLLWKKENLIKPMIDGWKWVRTK